MNLQQLHNSDFINELRSSTNMIRALVNSALSETDLNDFESQDTKVNEDCSETETYLRMILNHTSRIFVLLGDAQLSTALVRTEKPVSTGYRLAEDGCGDTVSETSLAVVRPSLLQLVTDSVPAIDLDNRQHLMRSMVQIMNTNNGVVTEESSTSLQPARQVPAPMVTIIDTPISSDANRLRYLFTQAK